VPRIVIIPAPEFGLGYVRMVGEALENHLEIIIAVDDEWKDLIVHDDAADLMLKLKMYAFDAVSGCKTGVGNVCPAVVLHRFDIALLWLDDSGVSRLLSVKEMVRRGEMLYVATPAEPPEEAKLFRLQTFKPLEPEHRPFFDDQFENLELEMYEVLRGSKDVERWRRVTRAGALPAVAEAAARATRRYVAELCVFGDYNVCPGMLLLNAGGRVDVKILKLTSKPENNYVVRVDLAGLLASNR
jgi:hypothetical protein